MKKQASSTRFFYQNGKLVTVNQGLQQRSIFRTVDMPLAEQHTTEAGGSDLLATDQQGSVLTMQADTDDEDHRFTPYGHAPTINSEKSLTGFTGEYLEALSHYYLLGTGYHRSYHTVLMRFLSPDSVSPFAEGGINAYAYCGGDPVNRIDPSGQNWFTSLFKGIGNRLHIRKPSPSTQAQKNKLAANALDIKYAKKKNEEILVDNNFIVTHLRESVSNLEGKSAPKNTEPRKVFLKGFFFSTLDESDSIKKRQARLLKKIDRRTDIYP